MKTLKRLGISSLGLILAAAIAHAQSVGIIQGTITDPTGAVVPNATVSAKNVATDVETTQPTNASGLFVVQLPPGVYTVQVTAPGFETAVRSSVNVDATATVGMDLKLTVGAASSQITVEENVVAIHTEDAVLGETMRNDVYESLPLAMNLGVPRDPTSFIALSPGVAAVVLQSAGPSYTSFNGAQQEMNGLYFEGMPVIFPNQQGDTRPLALGVSVDAVSQFQVEINGEGAAYQGQGFHNYVVKSGTDQLHGTLFEFLRNTDLDARGFFPAFVPNDKQNEYGGNVGGYIRKHKIFYFGNYDGYSFDTATAPVLLSLPSALERQGIFTELPAAQLIYDPLSYSCSGVVCSKTPFPGQTIYPSRLSPAAQVFESYLPTLKLPGVVNNYDEPLPRKLWNRNFTTKEDFNLSDKHRLYFVAAYGEWKTDYTGNITPTGTALPLPYTATPGIVVELPWIMQLHETYTISPRLLNNFAIGMTRLSIPIYEVTQNGDPEPNAMAAKGYPQLAGLTGPGLAPLTGQGSTGFPGLTFSGNNAPAAWSGTGAFNEWENHYVAQDTLQWIRGDHIMSFGTAYQLEQDNTANPSFGTDTTYTFSAAATQGFNASGALLASTGAGYADFMLGAVGSGSVVNNSVVEQGSRFHNWSLFAQDDWKASKKLTLNLGLRWDVYFPYSEQYNRSSYMNPNLPNPAVNNILGAMVYGSQYPQPVNTHWDNFEPRIGLAYTIDSKTVFRAGFVKANTVGTAGLGGGGGGGEGKNGYNPPSAIASAVTGVPAFYWPNVPAPAYPYPLLSPSFGTGNNGLNASPISPSIVIASLAGKSPEYINWNAGIQRQMPKGFVVGATYSASVGHFLPGGTGLGLMGGSMQPQFLALGSLLTQTVSPAVLAAANAIMPGIGLPFPTYTGTLSRMLTQFPQYGGMGCFSCNYGASNYNSGQLTIDRRASRDLTLQFAYTWAHEIDNIPSGGQLGSVGGARNPFNGALDRGDGAIDRRQNLHLVAVYNLPFGKGQHFLHGGNPVVDAVLGGWSLSTIYTLTTGAPLSVTGSNCSTPGITSTCEASLNPNYTGGNGGIQLEPWGYGNVIGGTAQVYVNKGAFVDPALYTFGNAPRSDPFNLRAPTLWNDDVKLRKDFKIREKYSLQLAFDFFNIFNAVVFSPPALNIDSATFGELTAQANAPRKAQASARFYF